MNANIHTTHREDGATRVVRGLLRDAFGLAGRRLVVAFAAVVALPVLGLITFAVVVWALGIWHALSGG